LYLHATDCKNNTFVESNAVEQTPGTLITYKFTHNFSHKTYFTNSTFCDILLFINLKILKEWNSSNSI